MVSGWKINRQDPAEKRLPSKLFNKVTSKLSGINLHDFDCGYKAYRRVVVDSINVYGTFHRYIPVIAYRYGFKITEIEVNHNKRKYGISKYGFERYLQGLLDCVSVFYLTKYSEKPMHLFGKIFILTIALSFISLVLGFFISKIFFIVMLCLLLSSQISLYTGLICNLIVEYNIKNNINDNHIEK